MESTRTYGNFKGRIGVLAEGELKALLCAAAGEQTKQIARTLGLAPGTVKKALDRAFFKLGVNNRAGLVGEALRRGVIGPLMVIIASFGGYQAATSFDGDHLRRGPSRRVVEMRVLKAREDAAHTA
ncbi:response regulator transcription factor [Pseudomonas oryzihabitans]|uniref:response regulator transcription factor n=1 Tax=Pseudomonas oryzihabitans TaxID=47885 RepID=UPI0011A91018|nr:helix-turn-helix transcriptional regulator [Pseudomonas psychrotolerans]